MFTMKSIVPTLRRVYSALEFANVSNIDDLNEMLDRHENGGRKNPSPDSSVPQGNREPGISNVYYLSASLHTR